MKSLKSELNELEYRREATIELLNQLLEELEGAPVQRRRNSGHPLDLLESAVNELIQALERAVESMVVVVLDRANRSRRG
ncbi:MAG: hypothetical protein KDK08_26270 [Rhizobiaceae bacterium]|nr:hypothetical protein [Rhizobiaceae bacterium]